MDDGSRRPVPPAPASIAAAQLKFSDLKQEDETWPREAVVDDFSKWPSEDLAIMREAIEGCLSIDVPVPAAGSREQVFEIAV